MRYSNGIIGVLLAACLSLAQAQNEGFLDNDGDSGGTSDDFLTPAQQDQRADGGNGGVPGNGQGSGEPVERFQDWGVRCGLGEDGPRNGCEMFQGVTRNDNDELVMRVAIAYPPTDQFDGPIAVFQLPLGMHLPSGVEVRIGESEPVSFPVQVCFQAGCRADLPLQEKLLERMKAGTRAVISIRGPRGQVELPLSLMGFTDALERISG